MKNQSVDLSTTYLGLRLKGPVVPSAGPLSRDLGAVRKLEESGAAAIVLHSLFEEQIRHETRELAHYLEHGTESYAEALSFFPGTGNYSIGPDEYLEHLRRVKETVAIPVIASLNGATEGGWCDYAQKMESAGADAIELNVYYVAADPEEDSTSVERRYLDVLSAVKSRVRIPVAVKLSPYFSALSSMARRFETAGADGLVLFNRFYQPDIDLESLDVVPNLRLSGPQDLRLPLRWTAILRPLVGLSLAASGGVETPADVLKLLLAGADVAMACSALLRHGPGHVRVLLDGVREWMEEREYRSVEQLKGSMSQATAGDPAAFERANYMKVLNSYR